MYPQQQNQDIFSKLLANKKLLILVIVGVVALLITIVTLIASSGSPLPGRVVAAKAHLEVLSEMTRDQGKELLNGDLRDQNANLGILLAGAKTDLEKVALELYGEKQSPDEKALAANAARAATLEADFESAMNTNTLDTTYQTEMAEEVSKVETQLLTYASGAKGKIGQALLKAADSLKQGREAFEKVQL